MKKCECYESSKVEGFKCIYKVNTNGVDTYKGIVFTPKYCPFCGSPMKQPKIITRDQIKR